MSDKAVPMAAMGEKKKLCARFDISKASMAKDLELGEEVTITVKGRVKSLRGPEEGYHEPYMKGEKARKYSYPGSVELELSSFTVDGEFSDFPEDD